ncbi:MAG: hypothetical protein ACLPV8_05485 [Steroidobacteraceae bacterium]
MDDLWIRILQNLSDRSSGPMHLRFLLQPIMATLLAIRSGLKDARAGRPPYLWSLMFHPYEQSLRRETIKDGWKSISKLCVAAVALDLIYQFIAMPNFFLRHAIIVAFLLVIALYAVIRGAVTRLASRLLARP